MEDRCTCTAHTSWPHVKIDQCVEVSGQLTAVGNSMDNFNSGSTRTAETLFDPEGFLNPEVLAQFSKYMANHRTQADGNIRNSDNWQKGMPKARYMRSMWRHFLDVWRIWRRGEKIHHLVDPLCAIMFNVHGMLLEVLISLGEVDRPIIRSEDNADVQN